MTDFVMNRFITNRFTDVGEAKMTGKFWRGTSTFGSPDAVYDNGKIWLGTSTFGSPNAVYEGGDAGAAACAFLFLLG